MTVFDYHTFVKESVERFVLWDYFDARYDILCSRKARKLHEHDVYNVPVTDSVS